MRILKLGTFNASTLVEGKGERIGELNDHLVSCGVDVCMVQETALKKKHINIRFNSYDLIREDRVARPKGGVAILIKKGIEYRVIPMHRIIPFQSLECTGIVLNLPGGDKLFVISIYNKNQRHAIGQDLSSILSVLRLDAPNHHFIFGGDFNARHPEWGNSGEATTRGRELLNWIEDTRAQFGTQIFTAVDPTRPVSSTFLDLFLTSESLNVNTRGIDNSPNCLASSSLGFSDHNLVTMSVVLNSSTSYRSVQPETESRFARIKRCQGSYTCERFQHVLRKTMNDSCFTRDDIVALGEKSLNTTQIDELVERFTAVIITALDRLSKKKSDRNCGPMLPAHINSLSREKASLLTELRFLQRNGGTANEIRLVKAQIRLSVKSIKDEWKVVEDIRHLDRVRRIQSASPSDFFRVINNEFSYKSSTGSTEDTFVLNSSESNLLRGTDPLELPSGEVVINGKDVDRVLCNDLEGTFGRNSDPLTVPTRTSKVDFSSSCSAYSIRDDRFLSIWKLCEYIILLNPKRSSGPDGISNFIIKRLPIESVWLLLIILNHCINLNYVPSIWKLSSVTFLKKVMATSGVVGNYRPISLMSNFGKLLERFYVGRLEVEIKSKDLISGNQFGFRPKRGTEHAINRVINSIQNSQVAGEKVGAVFVDFSKAFDSVNHTRLLERLRELHVEENIIDFFVEFLSGRSFVSSSVTKKFDSLIDIQSVNGHLIRGGVLQGSISGPVLFSLYVDKILRDVDDTIAYADDMVIIEADSDPVQLQANLERKFLLFKQAADSLKLKINIDKTKLMVFRGPSGDYFPREWKRIRSIKLAISNDMRIERVEEFKYLGVWLDPMLKFDLHVKRTAAKTELVYRQCRRIVGLDRLDVRKRLWFYKAVIRPVMTYACPIWLLVTPSLMDRLKTVELHVLQSVHRKWRRRGTYRNYSYRYLVEVSKIPAVDYFVINRTRRYLMRLAGSGVGTVNLSDPDWASELKHVRQFKFKPETFMFLDALGLIVDFVDRIRFYNLDRHGRSSTFDLNKHLDIFTHRLGKRHHATLVEIKLLIRDAPWLDWEPPWEQIRANTI